MNKRIEMVGRRFGRWTVVAPIEGGAGLARWLSRCDCGTVRDVRGDSLRGGGSLMCQACQIGALAEKVSTHKQSGSLTWKSWSGMRTRCLSPGVADYPRYGGAGITVAPEWGSFECFLADMGERPSSRHSIDRIDPTGNYTPGNCRWATAKEQNRNRRRTIWLVAKGRRQTLAAWAEELGVLPITLDKRRRAGWSDEDTVTRPVNSPRIRVQGSASI